MPIVINEIKEQVAGSAGSSGTWRALLPLVASFAFVPLACSNTRTDDQSPAPEQAGISASRSAEGESCSRTADCEGGLRCIQLVCVRAAPATSPKPAVPESDGESSGAQQVRTKSKAELHSSSPAVSEYEYADPRCLGFWLGGEVDRAGQLCMGLDGRQFAYFVSQLPVRAKKEHAGEELPWGEDDLGSGTPFTGWGQTPGTVKCRQDSLGIDCEIAETRKIFVGDQPWTAWTHYAKHDSIEMDELVLNVSDASCRDRYALALRLFTVLTARHKNSNWILCRNVGLTCSAGPWEAKPNGGNVKVYGYAKHEGSVKATRFVLSFSRTANEGCDLSISMHSVDATEMNGR